MHFSTVTFSRICQLNAFTIQNKPQQILAAITWCWGQCSEHQTWLERQQVHEFCHEVELQALLSQCVLSLFAPNKQTDKCITSNFTIIIIIIAIFTHSSIAPRIKKRKRLKTDVEWLEVRIIVPSEWFVEKGRIKTLDCDWQPLENERPFSAVTRHFTNLVAKVFKEMVCRVVHWAKGYHGDWKKSVCWSLENFWHFLAAASLATSPHPRAVVASQESARVLTSDVPYQQLPWAPSNLCRPIRAFIILTCKANWLLRCRHACRHQGSSHQIIQLLMSGYPAQSLFADKAMLAASIHQRSTTACVRGAKVQTKTECYSHTYRLII